MRPRVLLLLALIPLVAACSVVGSAHEKPDSNTFATAFEKTTDEGSFRIAFDMAMAIGDTNASFTGEGAFDYRRQRGRIVYDMSGLSKVDPELKGLGRMEMIFDGLVFYMQMDSLRTQVPGGRSWLKIDLRKAGAGADLGSLSPLGQSPAQQLDYLRAASKKFERKGKEEIRGVETTRYLVVVDVRKAAQLGAESAPPEFRDQIRRKVAEAVGRTDLEELPMEVWIDDEGLPRRIETMFGSTILGDGGTMNMSMDLFDFGVKVDVTPPPRARVLDLGEFMDEAQ
jgi:hypothetical protein